jgi:fused signal recognition particle receptor
MFNLFNKKKSADDQKQSSPVKNSWLKNITNLFSRGQKIDLQTLQTLEEKLLVSDIGVTVTQEIIEKLKERLKHVASIDSSIVIQIIREELENILAPCSKPFLPTQDIKPQAVLFIGVNGSGKTTTLGKLAYLMKKNGRSILLAAGDTFRAAAIEQLAIWGERNAVPVIAQKPGADSAAVIYDAFQAARARNIDLLMCDTAGRLHTHDGLINELKKIKRSLQKIDPQAPHEVLLVLDATTGQNAINQAKEFHDAIGITGIALTKLDGTARGGAIFAIAKAMAIPIYYMGTGEKIDDLEPFVAEKFIDAIFREEPC